MRLHENIKREIFDFLDNFSGYSDYDQKIEDVMYEFGLDRETAEGYVWDWSITSEEEYDDFNESFTRNRRRANKSRLKEFYHYNYDNQKIIDLLCKIEDTGDTRKINRAYDFVNRSCDNIDDCTESGWYDLSDASWGFGTDYIIEELTDILNESIRRVSRKKLHEDIDWTEDIDEVLNANKEYIEKIIYTDDWNVTNWDPEIKDKVLGKIRVRWASKDRAVWQYLGYTKWNDDVLIVNHKKEADSLSEIFDYISDFPVNRKKPSWKVRVFLPKHFKKR